jgi:hypothetical protein
VVTTAVDKWLAYARLSAVAQASHLPTAPTPSPGTRPVLILAEWFGGSLMPKWYQEQRIRPKRRRRAEFKELTGEEIDEIARRGKEGAN